MTKIILVVSLLAVSAEAVVCEGFATRASCRGCTSGGECLWTKKGDAQGTCVTGPACAGGGPAITSVTETPTASPTSSPTQRRDTVVPTLKPSFRSWDSSEPTSDLSKTIELRDGTCQGRDPLAAAVCPGGGITGPGVPCAHGRTAEAAARCHDACAAALGAAPAGVHLLKHYSTYHPDRCHCCCATTCDCYSEESNDLWWMFASFSAGPAAPLCPAPSPAPSASPSASPAAAPSAAPTTSPVPRPTAEPTATSTTSTLVPAARCVDADWCFKDTAKKSCAWVARKPLRRCGKKDSSGVRARTACCACACADGAWTLGTDSSKGCAWVTEKRTKKRCRLEDANGVAAKARCCACAGK